MRCLFAMHGIDGRHIEPTPSPVKQLSVLPDEQVLLELARASVRGAAHKAIMPSITGAVFTAQWTEQSGVYGPGDPTFPARLVHEARHVSEAF